MLFNSYIFILVFLPLCLTGYHLLNRFGLYRIGLFFLLGMSLWFYGYFNPWYLLLILFSIGGNYGLYKIIAYFGKKRPKAAKAVFILGIMLNLGALGYFKYTDFFIRNINALFRLDHPVKNILLPLGISFFTFQQISFLTDIYRSTGEMPEYGLLEYASYVAFFPQLVAGPIVTHDTLIPQLTDPARKRMDWEMMAKGLALFSLGLAKKVLLADAFGAVVNLCFSGIDFMNSSTAIIAVISYTFQIYFDFSGYSDMAIGLGWMLMTDLPVNFDSPYKADSIHDFWRRWHMTLTAFFRKYVYFPLGGSRKGKIRTCINTFIVFFLSGLWHGAGWTFVLWGVMHGIMMIIESLAWDGIKKIPSVIRRAFTFVFVSFAWVFFRADSINDGIKMIKCILRADFGSIAGVSGYYSSLIKKLLQYNGLTGIIPLSVPTVIFIITGFIIVFGIPNARFIAENSLKRKTSFVWLAALLCWCLFSFGGMTTFLYFNF